MLHRLPALLFSVLLFAPACGGDDDGGGGGGSGGGGGAAADASPPVDSAPLADSAPPDADPQLPDSGPIEVTCADEPLPTTAADPVTVSGTVVTLSGLNQVPVAGATVEARRVSDDGLIVSGTSAADGSFQLQAATGGVPVDAYLAATGDNYVNARVYPPFPVASNLSNIPVPLLTENILGLLYVASGNVPRDPDLATVIVIVTDCDLNPVAGATVSSTPAAGEVVYGTDDGLPSANASSTGAQGIVFLLNVPVTEDLVVQATANGQPLRAHAVSTLEGQVTATSLTPHAANL